MNSKYLNEHKCLQFKPGDIVARLFYFNLSFLASHTCANDQ